MMLHIRNDAVAPRALLAILVAFLANLSFASALAASATNIKSSRSPTPRTSTGDGSHSGVGGYAYVTLMFGGIPKQIDITRVLIRSIKRHGSRHPMVVMITPEVPEVVRETLRLEGAIVKEVEPLTAKGTLFTRNSLAFTKLRAWSLTEYERVVFLDADMLPVENLDVLFEHDACGADLCAVRNPDFTGNIQKYALNSAIFVLRPDVTILRDMLAELDQYPGDEYLDLYAEQGFFNAYVANLTVVSHRGSGGGGGGGGGSKKMKGSSKVSPTGAYVAPYTFSDLHRRYDSCGMNDLQPDFDVAVHHPCAFIRRWKPSAVRLIEVTDPADLVPNPREGEISWHDVPYMHDPHLPTQVWAWEPAAREVGPVDRDVFEIQRVFSTFYAEANKCFAKYDDEKACRSREARAAGCVWCVGKCGDSKSYCDAVEAYAQNVNFEHKFFWPPAQLLFQPLREGDNVYNVTYHWPAMRLARRRIKYCEHLRRTGKLSAIEGEGKGEGASPHSSVVPPQLDMPSFPRNAKEKGTEMRKAVTKAVKDVKCAVCKMLVHDATDDIVDTDGTARAQGLRLSITDILGRFTKDLDDAAVRDNNKYDDDDDDDETQDTAAISAVTTFVNASTVMSTIHRACYGLGVGGAGPRSTAARDYAILPSPGGGIGVGKRFVFGRKIFPKPTGDTLDRTATDDEWLRDIFVTNNFEYYSLASACRTVLKTVNKNDIVAAINLALTTRFEMMYEKDKREFKVATSVEKRACSKVCTRKSDFPSKPPPKYLKDEASGPGMWDEYHVKNVGCLRVNKGYWSYEVCYRGRATQFHHEGHRVVERVDLGEYDEEATMTHIRSSFKSGEMQRLNRRHLSKDDMDVHFYPEVLIGGAPCDEHDNGDDNTMERRTLVRWACAQDGKERLVVSDARRYKGGCGAEIVGFTRSLCGDPRFAPFQSDDNVKAAGVGRNVETLGNIRKLVKLGDGGDAALVDGDGGFKKRGHSTEEERVASGQVISEIRRLRRGHGYCGDRTADLPALDPLTLTRKATAAARGCLGGVGGSGGGGLQCSAGGDGSGAADGGWDYFGPVKPFAPIRRRIEIGGLLESENMKVGAEIGVLGGNFAAHLLRDWHGCERYLMVDPWLHMGMTEHTFDRFQNEDLMNRALDAARQVNNSNAEIEVCRNFSTACAPLYPDGSFDFVYVDARHDYASAMEDIRAWWPKVRRGGILAGHDYVDAIEAASIDDWSIQVDGTRDNLARAVQGAVDEFSKEVNRQVFVVYEERPDDINELKDYPNFPTWLIRK